MTENKKKTDDQNNRELSNATAVLAVECMSAVQYLRKQWQLSFISMALVVLRDNAALRKKT